MAQIQDPKPTRVVFHVDPEDRITYVDTGWVQEAMNGHAPTLAHGAIGTSLFDHVEGTVVQDVYRRLLHAVRQGHQASFTFRCDAPAVRRLLEMEVTPLGAGEVSFRTRTIFEIPRESVDLLRIDLPRSDEPVQICAWCHRLRMPEWTEIEEANRLIAGRRPLPTFHYAICEDDRTRFEILFESLGRRPA